MSPARRSWRVSSRELREELAVDAHVGEEVFTTSHAYPDRTVELHFFACGLVGVPQPQVGQEMRWVAREELTRLKFPPADVALIEVLTENPPLVFPIPNP